MSHSGPLLAVSTTEQDVCVSTLCWLLYYYYYFLWVSALTLSLDYYKCLCPALVDIDRCGCNSMIALLCPGPGWDGSVILDDTRHHEIKESKQLTLSRPSSPLFRTRCSRLCSISHHRVACMEEVDWISNLPPSIIESILTRLPIRDAIRTSILSRAWRYKWATITELVFDDYCVDFSSNPDLDEEKLIKFISRCLFLHQGPIHKFKLSTSCLQFSPEIDQWMLFLSRHDLKHLVLDLGEVEWFRVPWCLFNCLKLTHLELSRCELDPPPCFKGFLNLKTLNLHQILVSDDTIDRLISSSPFLESLSLSYFDDLAITISAPMLKYLHLEGEFKDICLENTPLLVSMSIAMYTGEDYVNENSGGHCNFTKFFGGVPRLERLVGQVYFTKYLSVGYYPGVLSATYNHLKVIELYQVSFEDMKEIVVVLQLITSSPNLQELVISGSSHTAAASHATDLDYWKKERPFNCSSLMKLKVIKLTDLAYVPHEMEFIKFMLRNSPFLEEMHLSPSVNVKEMLIYMLTELVKFHRASARAAIIFDHNCLEK